MAHLRHGKSKDGSHTSRHAKAEADVEVNDIVSIE